jgi:hypothetical protein
VPPTAEAFLLIHAPRLTRSTRLRPVCSIDLCDAFRRQVVREHQAGRARSLKVSEAAYGAAYQAGNGQRRPSDLKHVSQEKSSSRWIRWLRAEGGLETLNGESAHTERTHVR